jgi:signal transduction histidine kinase
MTRRIGRGEFSGRLALRQRDEIGELAEEINVMCERIVEANRKLGAETEARIATLEQLRHADRLATVGRLASGVAHELGTPLSVASARAELISAGDLSWREAGEHARVIIEQSERMAQVIRQLLDFSRRQRVDLRSMSLSGLVARTVSLVVAVAERHGVTIDVQAGDDRWLVRIDEYQLQQALLNVILNAVQAMRDGGRVSIRVASRRAGPPAGHPGAGGRYLAVVVEDEGSGISRDDLPHVFEPFFTTKSPGEGTGLGLAVAHGIVSEHGGWIDVESEVGKGSRFSIWLPQAEEAGSAVFEAAS